MAGSGFDVDDGECIYFPFVWLFGLCLLVKVWGVWDMWRSEGGGWWWACRVDGNRRLTCWRAPLISFDADLNYFVLCYFYNEIE